MKKNYIYATPKSTLQRKNASSFSAFLIAIFALFAIQLNGQSVSQTFTTNGTFTVPAGVTSVTVEAWGGGGAGGGARGTTTAARSGGGGGGGTYTRSTVAVTPSANITYTIGAGGTGNSNAAGNNGGTTIFNSAIAVSAIGGNGGGANNGAGGAIATGITQNGGAGAAGVSAAGGGGGGGAGSTGNGGNAAGSAAGAGGTGGGGAGAIGTTANSSDGTAAAALAGGGGGARSVNGFLSNGTARAGGNGFRGQIIVTYTLPTLASVPSIACANTSITLNGTNFIAPLTVTFNGTAASSVTIISPTQLSVIVPATATTGNIRVTTATGFTTNPAITTISNPVISGPPSICVGNTGAVFTSSTGSGTWTSSNTAVATIDPVTGAVTPLSQGTTVFTFTDAATGCQANSSTININVPPVSVSDPVALNTVCDDDPVSLSILATGGSLTYQWYKGGIPVVNGGNISGANTDTLNFVPIHVSDSAASYYCVVTNSCTSVTSGIAKVIVNLKPKIPTQATSACTGLAFSVSPVDGVPTAATIVPAGTTYSWPAPIVTGGMTGGASGSSQTAIDGTLINPTNTAQTATYTVTPVSGTTGNCVGNAFLVTVTVNPAPSIGNQVGSACSGNAFTFAPVNGAGNIIPAGTTYTWGIPTVTGGITGATALSNQPSFIQTLINPTNAVQTATYTITATSGTCVGSTFTMVLSVNPKPTVAADLTSQNICSGFAIAPITLTNPNGVPGTTSYSWTRSNTTNIIGPISGSGNTINLTLTNTTGVQQTTVFTFYATSEEGCVSVAGTASVTVDPSPVVTAIASQSVCSGSSIATVNFASSVVGATFTWTRTDNTSLSGIPLSGNGNSLSGTFVNSTNTPQSTTFTVSATSGSCSVAANSATFTVTVKPIPLASASPSTQTVCAGSPILITASDNNNVSGTVFSFSQNNTVSGDNMSISGNLITGSLVNNTTVDRTVIFTINATAAGCPSSTTVSVTVSPNPVINATPATQNVCSGAPITTINLPAIAGVVYSWTRTNGTALGNLTGMPDSDSNATSITGTLTNNTASNQSTTFTITATLGGCTKTASVTVNVFAPMSGSVGISADQVVCPGGTPAALFVSTPPTGGSGAYTYQWQSSTVSNTGPWVNIGTGSTYQPPTTTAGTLDTYYRLIITGCQSFTSNVIKIEVPIFGLNNSFTINDGIAAAGNVICSNTTFTPYIKSDSNLLNYSLYSWNVNGSYFSPSTGGVVGTQHSSGFFGIEVYTDANIGPITAVNNTNANVTVAFSIVPTVYFRIGDVQLCNLTAQSFNVTIRPVPVATATGNGNNICNTTATGIVVSGNITDATMYFTWVRSDSNSNVTSTQPSGNSGTVAIGGTFSIPDVPTNSTLTSQPITYTITPYSTACGIAGTPITVTINVDPFLPGTISGNQTLCSGGDPTAFTETPPAGGTSYSYQWQSSTVGPTGPFSNIATNSTSPTYDPPAGITQTTWYIRVVTSIVNGQTCSVATTLPVKVSVNSITPGSISGSQTLCSGSNATLASVAATGAGTITYQWQSNITGCGGVWANITGATSAGYTANALTQTTYFRRVATSTLNGSPCVDYSNCVVVTVNTVNAGTIGSDEVVCGNNPSAFTDIIPASGAGVLAYQWQSNTTGCGGTFTNIAGATSPLYDPPSGFSTTTYFRRVVTSTLNAVTCSAVSNCITITANSVTAGSIGPGNQTICSGSDPAIINSVTAGTGVGLTYQWQSSLTAAAGSWTDIAGATAASYDPPGPVIQTTYFRRAATATVGIGTCQAFTAFITVFVNNVTAPAISGDQTVCGNDPSAFTLSAAATGSGVVSYQWQSNTVSCSGAWTNIPGATSATYDPPVLSLTTYYHLVATSTLNGVQCTAVSNCVTVTSFAKTWNGSVSNDWNTAGNWTPNGVPTSGNCVIIPNVTPQPYSIISGSGYIGYAKNLTIYNGGRLDVNPSNSIVVTDDIKVIAGGGLYITNSANLVQINNTTNTGIATVQRITEPMYRFDYTYWNSPMVMGTYTLGDLSQNLTQFDKYYSWNPSFSNGNGGWVQESATTIMNPTKGYIVRAPNTFSFNPAITQPYTASFVGTPNNGDVQIPIKIGTLGAGTYNDKMNLIGNPYASAVSALAFVSDPVNVPLVDGTIYFWTHHAPPSSAFPNPFYGNFQLNYSPAGYASLNALGGTNTVPSGYGGPTPIDNIASGQGFFVIGKATGTAYFRNSMRRTGNNGVFFRTANPYTSAPTSFESHRVWLNLADTQGSFSQILVGYAEGATNGQDRNFDGENFSASGISLYSINDDKKYGIQGRALPFDENDVVPLGYNSTVAREFTIGIDHLDGLFESQNVYLEDKLLNVIHDIKQSPYTFTTGVGMFDDRFLLRYTNETLGVENPNATIGLTAFIKDKKLHIQADRDISSVEIYDLTGKLVRTYLPNVESHTFDEEFVFAQGIYLGKIKLTDGITATVKLSNGN